MSSAETSPHAWPTLLAGLTRIYDHNPFHRLRWQAAGLDPHTFSGPHDLARIPFLTKEELIADQAKQPPNGTNLTEPFARYVRVHSTSGTSGRRLTWLDTAESWSFLLDGWDRIFQAAQLQSEDRLAFPFSFGPFLGFWTAFEAATRAGRCVLPAGGLSSLARLELMRDQRATVLLTTPTYAQRLLDVARDQNFPMDHLVVRKLILAGEPGANIPETRQRIADGWQARVLDHSGMTETGPMTAEFIEQPGVLYHLDETAWAEILDPQTLEPTSEGELGELVVTTMGRWASPVVRYRTGDLVRARIYNAPDGRRRLAFEGGILARTDDMLSIRGNNIYPSAIESVVRSFPEIDEFQIFYEHSGGSATLGLQVEMQTRVSDETSIVERLVGTLRERFYLRIPVVVVPPGSLPRSEHKSARLVRRSSN